MTPNTPHRLHAPSCRALRNGSNRTALLVIVSLVLGWAGVIDAGTTPRKDVHVSERKPESVVYKTTPQGELSMLVFRPDAGAHEGPRPAVVFFHGGGWVKGNPNQFSGYCNALNDHGVVGISVEYRLKAKHGTTPFESVIDAFSAMRFVREHADAWGLDAERIGAGGGSAGGHLAAAVATLDPANYREADDTVPDDDTVFRPDALLLFNPVYDNGPKGFGRNVIGDRWPTFSPFHNIHADMPPTLVMLGDMDNLIPVETAESFRDQMQAVGVRSDLIVYPGQKHGFFNANQSPEMHEQTKVDMLAFLDEIGFFDKAGATTP